MLRVELLENVRGQRRVTLDSLDDLLPFFMRGALDDVRDLRGMQAP